MAEIVNRPEDDVVHCQDCCCARSWKALGISEYTGLSIPEHIQQLREALVGEVGLVQLLTARSDLRAEREAILSNHRHITALAALGTST